MCTSLKCMRGVDITKVKDLQSLQFSCPFFSCGFWAPISCSLLLIQPCPNESSLVVSGALPLKDCELQDALLHPHEGWTDSSTLWFKAQPMLFDEIYLKLNFLASSLNSLRPWKWHHWMDLAPPATQGHVKVTLYENIFFWVLLQQLLSPTYLVL